MLRCAQVQEGVSRHLTLKVPQDMLWSLKQGSWFEDFACVINNSLKTLTIPPSEQNCWICMAFHFVKWKEKRMIRTEEQFFKTLRWVSVTTYPTRRWHYFPAPAKMKPCRQVGEDDIHIPCAWQSSPFSVHHHPDQWTKHVLFGEWMGTAFFCEFY